ncbi:MAG: hypothetical protein A2Y73_09210 [Chloroflexi bacterium RBG_13_56_8]|nr:MAG: hypothetical protein A2Y73_09210 [Chloroflexi bacterium RBG_13_56_8]
MTWAPLLLADPSPCLRMLVLRELFHRPEDDPEVRELAVLREEDPLIADLLALQAPDGSWKAGSLPGSTSLEAFHVTSQALARLGYLGCGPHHPAVERGAEYLFSQQQEDGAWPLPQASEEKEEREGYSMIPLQTALPLKALALCGYATDPRAERAYEWLLAQRLPDGAWPTGIASGNYGGVAGYRRLAHSRWGCRSNTTGALLCLALHPERRSGAEARRALDLLLGRETRERHTLGFEVARLMGAEPTRGFLTYYARFDLALILDLCWRVGAAQDDARVAELVEFMREAQGPYGLWEYTPRPQASRWVTFDLLRSLIRLDTAGDWLSMEPRTPFQGYPRRVRRF